MENKSQWSFNQRGKIRTIDRYISWWILGNVMQSNNSNNLIGRRKIVLDRHECGKIADQ